ncbi:hypothetical protein FACS189426_08340 [Bacteroidia bacterium]|nr:hypothetical protein FACS189426_08340 [Bacteroidia bacterium]
MTITRNRLKRLLPAVLLLFSVHCLQAQVTIGSNQTPHDFSVLELTSDSKGLRLPQLTTAQRNAWSEYFLGNTVTNPADPSGGSLITPDQQEKARGLVIYNIDTDCMECWNTQKWILLCDQTCAEPIPGTVIPSGDQPPVPAAAGAIFKLGPVSVDYTSGSPQTAYQWYRNNTKDYAAATELTGETSNTLTDSQTAGTYYYFCEMTNADCTSNLVRTSIYTVTVTAPLSIPLGPGTLSGKTCFDINKSNWEDGCGTQASRTSLAVDFATLPPVIYTFTAPNSGTINDLHFQIEDPVGCVASYSGGKSGAIIHNEKIELTVNYATDLSDVFGRIYERTRDEAAHVTIYAIYHDGAKEVGVPLLVKIQDCVCCGAYVAAGVWKEFMCHNMGADQNSDPFTPAKGLNGDYYQWGQKDPIATVETPFSAIPTGWIYSGIVYGLWSEDSKTENDPCPEGYRVPTLTEWAGVIEEDIDNSLRLNPRTDPPGASWNEDETNFSSGRFFGPGLYLPAAGHFADWGGLGGLRNKAGFYWSSHRINTARTGRLSIYENEEGPSTDDNVTPYYGYSVRCIAK